MMPSNEWKDTRLADVIDIKHGYAFQGEYFRDEPPGDILLTPGNFEIGGGFKPDKFKYYLGPVSNDFVLAEGDLLVTMTDLSKQADTLGYPALIPRSEGTRFLHNQRLGRILIRSEAELDKRFLYYLLCTPKYRHEVLASATGTTVKHTSPNRIMAFRFDRPPIKEQRAIAGVLSPLDDKIELNRRMNETLEDLARSLFRSWFIDFDPVRANAEGRDSGIPRRIADLFPRSFDESEQGEIPKGWEVKTIEAVAQRVGMGPFGSSIKVETFVPEGIPVISGQHLHGFMLEDNTFNFITLEHADELKAANVQRGDVVFTHAGNIGQAAYIPEDSHYDRYVISQRQFFMRCDVGLVTPSFVAFYFGSPEGQHKLLANSSSSGVPSIARPVTYLRSIELIVPPKPIMDAFDSLVEPLLQRFRRNQNEIHTLAAMRDALLPKLISGKVPIKGAERITWDNA